MARRSEIIHERRNHEHDFVDYPNPAVDWCATNLALQFRLGLLAKWRTRLNSFDPNYSRVNRQPLNRLALARKNGLMMAFVFDDGEGDPSLFFDYDLLRPR